MPLSKAWFEAMARSAPDATILLDRERRIRFANDAAEQLAARSGGTNPLVGQSYDAVLENSLILEEDGSPTKPESFPTHLALERGIETRGHVFEQIHADQHYWISVTCTPVFDHDGTAVYAAVYFRDVSRQKNLEENLDFLLQSGRVLSLAADDITRLSEKARLIVPKLADWCTVNLVEENGTLRRVAVVHRDKRKEKMVEELARLSAEELGSEVGIHAVHKTGLPQFTPNIRIEDFESTAFSSQRLRLMQELKPVSSIILPIHSQGKLVGILSIAYAESARRYSEEDFAFMQEFCHHLGVIIDNARLYDEVRKRDQAKGRFLADLSHELRNPLAPIKSHLELLALMNPDERYRAEVELIEHQFNHLARLLNDLLDASRYALGTIEIDRCPIALGEHIERIVRIQEPHIRQKGLELSVELTPEDIIVSADPTRLEQAILNVLNNAKKFTPSGGRIVLSVHTKGTYACISVRDSGIGMHADELSRLFREQAVGQPRRSAGRGLGLGLILVRRIIEFHGGRVEASSDGPGRGSEFRIFVPMQSAAALGSAARELQL
ncbi:MAG: ATP-binding protein [Minisyncoccia bacterium]